MLEILLRINAIALGAAELIGLAILILFLIGRVRVQWRIGKALLYGLAHYKEPYSDCALELLIFELRSERDARKASQNPPSSGVRP